MEHRLPHSTTAARRARRLADDFVREHGGDARVAEFLLLVSEVVANAVRHGEPEADGRIGLRLEAEGCSLRAVVTDAGPGFTFKAGMLDPSELGHLGLALVDGLSDRWGLSLDGKKAVWFELDVSGERPAEQGTEP